MSISASLANALSGLTASSRAAQLVSNNVANVTTEGYGRREIALSSRSVDGSGAGVQVDGVRRVVDQGILRDRRLADSALGFASDRADSAKRLAGLVGTPDQERSVTGRLRTFEARILEAASRPDSDTRLAGILNAAKGLSATLNAAADGVQAERLRADGAIAAQVRSLNDGLLKVQDLNTRISSLNGRGRDVSALEDQRQTVIDGLAKIVPMREVPRDDGRVSLYTSGGAILLDDTPRQLAFSKVNLVTADMTLASGALSGITIDGRAARTDGTFAPLGGGTLAAAFDIRDRLAPEAQGRLDSFARDLVERFSDPATDPTLTAGAPGLFTDAGAAFDAANEVGLAGRLSTNGLADPAEGGALRLLRDGLGATVAGEPGNAARINALADALTANRVPGSSTITTAERSAFTLAADLTSLAAFASNALDQDKSFAAAEQSTLRGLELNGGVDTDQELQKLLLIEQSYAANARVVQTVDRLIQDLLAI